MAIHKKKETKKTNKKIVKKHTNHMVVKKKPEEEKKPQPPEVQHDAPVSQQAPISESVGGPVVIPSGVMQDTPKEERPQPAISSPQPVQQSGDALTSMPSSVTSNAGSTEIGVVTQNPLIDDAEKDKPEENIEEPKKNKSWIVIVVIVISIIFIAGVLWYFRENAVKQISVEDKIISTPSPSRVSPTPATDSAKLVIDYSKYKVKVLNGSGIGGAAAKGKVILESEKFVIEEIGNAETSDYDLTIIQAKKEVPKAFLDKLKSLLEKTYKIAPNEELEDTEEVDVVIIIGSGKQP